MAAAFQLAAPPLNSAAKQLGGVVDRSSVDAVLQIMSTNQLLSKICMRSCIMCHMTQPDSWMKVKKSKECVGLQSHLWTTCAMKAHHCPEHTL